MFGIFKKQKKQDWNAEIGVSGKTFTVTAGDNLLKSALGSGVQWPHDCRVGSCGTCKCKLKSGQIKELSDFSYVLSQEDLQAGMILACQSELQSDVQIEVDLLEDSEQSLNISSHKGLIHSMNPLTHDIVELVIKADEDIPRNALAGQYAEISVNDIDQPRSYSFAKSPTKENDREVSFFVRRVPDGEFTEWLFADDRVGESVDITGPYGSFYLRPGQSPIVCVAGGSGMAPIKALLEHARDNNCRREVLYLFGARSQRDLYCLDIMEQLKSNWKGKFEFIPVLSEEPEDSGWEGARGFVTDHLKQTYIDTNKVNMAKSQGYLCGPPPMIDAAIEIFTAAGMDKDDVHFDKFLDASSMPGGRN